MRTELPGLQQDQGGALSRGGQIQRNIKQSQT